MQRYFSVLFSVGYFCSGAAGCGGGKERLFQPKPECEGQAVEPLAGNHPMVISALEIGDADDGFDLDGDGEPDNQLAGVGDLAGGAIEDSLSNFDIVIPMEFFDFAEPGADDCVKFALYVGQFRRDQDMDGAETAVAGGDCNDGDDAIGKGAAEVPDNLVDDDCDGLADEAEDNTPSTNADDSDGDGVTIADGDCDDTNDQVAAGMDELCSDGLDNDCDGNADYATDESGAPLCTPFDDVLEPLYLDPLSFDDDGSPIVAFDSGTVTDVDGALELSAGPSVFAVQIPVRANLNLDLKVTGATILGDVVMTPGGYAIKNGRLAGVLDSHTADDVRGLDVEEINLTPENSLLDAAYANVLGAFLALPKIEHDEFTECRTPDVDVDRDGLEAFCDSDPLDNVKAVDVCIDGNGFVVRDVVDDQGNLVEDCTDAVDNKGELRFVDGISVEFNFETTPAMLPESLP